MWSWCSAAKIFIRWKMKRGDETGVDDRAGQADLKRTGVEILPALWPLTSTSGWTAERYHYVTSHLLNREKRKPSNIGKIGGYQIDLRSQIGLSLQAYKEER